MNINIGQLNVTIKEAINEAKTYFEKVSFIDESDIDYLNTLFKYLDKNKYNYQNLENTYIIHLDKDTIICKLKED